MEKEHRGQATGTNKSEDTGITAGKITEDEKRDKELTEKYMDSESAIAQSVKQNNPNCNVDQDDATTSGGYRN